MAPFAAPRASADSLRRPARTVGRGDQLRADAAVARQGLSGLARKFVGGRDHAASCRDRCASWASMRCSRSPRSGAGEFPAERSGDGVVADLECGEAVADLAEVGEVVGVEDFALDDGEVDFCLVQPGGVHGQVDQVRVRPGFVIRLIEAAPRWEDPLSAIQYTRSALA